MANEALIQQEPAFRRYVSRWALALALLTCCRVLPLLVETRTSPDLVATIHLVQLTSARWRKDPIYQYQKQQWPGVVITIASVLLTMVFLVQMILLSRQSKIPALSS